MAIAITVNSARRLPGRRSDHGRQCREQLAHDARMMTVTSVGVAPFKTWTVVRGVNSTTGQRRR
jgi:hypothetical protein